MKYVIICLAAAAVTALIVTAVIVIRSKGHITDRTGMVNSYAQISQDEAAEMMKKDDGHIIVDVRRQDEYDEGHIPGAVCIPNESIGAARPALLPDTDRIILVYCRSGRRSKEAAQKLFDMGYTNVYEFGGIIDWKGEITTEEQQAPPQTVKPAAALVIEANGKRFYAVLEDNSSAEAFAQKLNGGGITVQMSDYGNYEKVGKLPWELPRNDERITTSPGDVILYQGNNITLYYDENTWSFTRLARISGATKEKLLDALGEGDAEAKFYLEWSE